MGCHLQRADDSLCGATCSASFFPSATRTRRRYAGLPPPHARWVHFATASHATGTHRQARSDELPLDRSTAHGQSPGVSSGRPLSARRRPFAARYALPASLQAGEVDLLLRGKRNSAQAHQRGVRRRCTGALPPVSSHQPTQPTTTLLLQLAASKQTLPLNRNKLDLHINLKDLLVEGMPRLSLCLHPLPLQPPPYGSDLIHYRNMGIARAMQRAQGHAEGGWLATVRNLHSIGPYMPCERVLLRSIVAG